MNSTSPRSVLALHGLGGGPYELRPLIDALAGFGCRVEAPTLPGHDTAGPVMPRSTWNAWVEVATDRLRALASEGGPVAVVGFSTGATLALELAAEHAGLMDRQVLICPFLAIRHYWFYGFRPEAYLRAPWSRWLHHVPRRPTATRDPEGAKAVASMATGRYRTFNLDAAREALALIDRVRAKVPRVTAPTLILQAELDTVVDPSCARWLHEHLGSPSKEIVWLSRSDHLAAWDYDREALLQKVSHFLMAETE